jgi:hypothetical protein
VEGGASETQGGDEETGAIVIIESEERCKRCELQFVWSNVILV